MDAQRLPDKTNILRGLGAFHRVEGDVYLLSSGYFQLGKRGGGKDQTTWGEVLRLEIAKG